MADPFQQQAQQDPSVVGSRAQSLLKSIKSRQEVERQRLELMFAMQNAQAEEQSGAEQFLSKVQAKRDQLFAKANEQNQQQASKKPQMPEVAAPEIPLMRGGRGGAAAVPQYGMGPDLTAQQAAVQQGRGVSGGGGPIAGALAGTGGSALAAAGQQGVMHALGGTTTQQQGPGLDQTTTTQVIPGRELSGMERFGAWLDKDYSMALSGQIPEYRQESTVTQGPSSQQLIQEYSALSAEIGRRQRAGKQPDPNETAALKALESQLPPQFLVRAKGLAIQTQRGLEEQAAVTAFNTGVQLSQQGLPDSYISGVVNSITLGDTEQAARLIAEMPQTLAEKQQLAAIAASQGSAAASAAQARIGNLQADLMQSILDQRKAQIEASRSPGMAFSSLMSGDWFEQMYGRSVTADPTGPTDAPLMGLFKGMGSSRQDPSPDDVRAMLNANAAELRQLEQAMVDKEGELVLQHKGSYDLARSRFLLSHPDHPLILMRETNKPWIGSNEPGAFVTDWVNGTDVVLDMLTAMGWFDGNPRVRGLPRDQAGNVVPELADRVITEAGTRLENLGFVVTRDVDAKTNELSVSISVNPNDTMNGMVLDTVTRYVNDVLLPGALAAGVQPAEVVVNSVQPTPEPKYAPLGPYIDPMWGPLGGPGSESPEPPGLPPRQGPVGPPRQPTSYLPSDPGLRGAVQRQPVQGPGPGPASKLVMRARDPREPDRPRPEFTIFEALTGQPAGRPGVMVPPSPVGPRVTVEPPFDAGPVRETFQGEPGVKGVPAWLQPIVGRETAGTGRIKPIRRFTAPKGRTLMKRPARGR